MVPPTTRRQYLSGLSIAGVTALAGCSATLVPKDGSGTTDVTTDAGSAIDEPTAASTGRPRTRTTESPTTEASDERGSDSAPQAPSAPLDARVVDRVTFDTERDRARVHFVDSPVADSVTVAAKQAFSSTSSSTPASITYLDVYPDPEGDAVVVTATIDGESRQVYLERYPQSYRVVDEVTYTDHADGSPRDASARVSLTGAQTGGRLTVESTVAGAETTLEPAGDASYAVVGVDPAGDEIVVTLTADGTTEVVHRERYRP